MGKILVMMMVTMMMLEMVRVEGEQSSSEAPAVVQPRLSYLVYALGEVLCNAWSMQCSWYALYVIPHTLSLGTTLSQAVGQPRLSCSQDGVVKVCTAVAVCRG